MAKGTYPVSDSGDNNRGRHFLNNLSANFSAPRETMDDVNHGGQVLFRNFLDQEVQQTELEGVVDDFLFGGGDALDFEPGVRNAVRQRRAAEATPLSPTQTGRNLDWRRMGSSLRDIADAFARSREGQDVRQRAEAVSLNDINQDGFINMMKELFTNGITVERVVALFFFCTTLIIRSATQKRGDMTRNLFSWSLAYIREGICQWVFEHGGWEQVLTNIYPTIVKFGVITLIALGIVCGGIFIYKNV